MHIYDTRQIKRQQQVAQSMKTMALIKLSDKLMIRMYMGLMQSSCRENAAPTVRKLSKNGYNVSGSWWSFEVRVIDDMYIYITVIGLRRRPCIWKLDARARAPPYIEIRMNGFNFSRDKAGISSSHPIVPQEPPPSNMRNSKIYLRYHVSYIINY